LTIGDGRFGTDAIALARRGATEVHATDITGKLLEIAHRRGLIDSWSVQNVEELDFDNDTFDYVFCKESFHHFPRPYVAINEMLRVSRKGIILIEPRDHIIDTSFHPIANLVTVLRNRSSRGYWFEEVGNFVYTVSERELEKAMLGVGLTNVAFKGINDVYETGVEFLELDSRGKMRFKLFSLYFKLFLKDMLCYASITKSSLLVAALFKQAPSNELVPLLQRSGFKIKKLPTNPFRLNVLL
jgi:ubiquinone/menaquinone biosynthesis C-methylase UbiE